MTDLLLTHARLIDPEADSDAPGWLHIRDGVIVASGNGAAPQGIEQVLDCRGKCLAPGIVDIGVKVCEPGERHKESYASAGRAAAAGGVTTMITRPDTTQAIDSPESLEFVARRAQADASVHVRHMAALTKGRQGREMAEIGFLLDAGAVAFSDCDAVTRNTKVLSRALTYARSLDALVMLHPQEPVLSDGAVATSGKFASLRGLPAVSAMAERMGLDRDIALIEMTGVRAHFDQITTARALPALQRAKRNGLDVTAGISIHHLTLNEMDVADYRTFFKVKPPLRAEDDRQAMIEALRDGLIDVICSMHTPQDEESKRLPFEEAAAGAVALETLLPAALRLYHAEALTLPQLFRALSLAPARRLGLAAGRLAAGAPADLVLFDAHAPFVLDRFKLHSKSKNTPFDGARMQGRVLATFVAGARVYGEP
ncbi:dihydroorotase, multifunctional complex type [Marinovum algicola DG 898]|nr:dihydroorotase, multifunctional complex type [Marinovum algicola DG 898]